MKAYVLAQTSVCAGGGSALVALLTQCFYGAARHTPDVTLTAAGLWCQELSSLCREHSVVIT